MMRASPNEKGVDAYIVVATHIPRTVFQSIVLLPVGAILRLIYNVCNAVI